MPWFKERLIVNSIGGGARSALHHGTLKHQAKHFFYAAGWKKFEPLWDLIIRARQLGRVTPLLEAVLSKLTSAKTVSRKEPGDATLSATPMPLERLLDHPVSRPA